MNRENTYISFDSVDCDLVFPNVPSPCSSSEYGWSLKDEILLDPDDRPLELTVNSKSPLTFHLATGRDRNAELLKNLRSEHFTPEQRRKLIEKFNLTNEVDLDDLKSLDTSATSTPHHRPSLSGSSTSGSIRTFPKNNRATSPLLTAAMAKLNGYNDVIQKVNTKHANVTPVGLSSQANTKSLTGNNETRSTRPPISTAQSSKPRNGRMRNVKQKKDNLLPKRQESWSMTGRNIFFSLRKYRNRSSSQDRNNLKISQLSTDAENNSPTKATELSSDVNLPGILKIFGDAVTPGANYKSVMATKNSSSRELVKIALQRYGVSKLQSKDYVLCEVIGRINEEEKKSDLSGLKVKNGKNKKKAGSDHSVVKANEMTLDRDDFIEDYIRPLNDHEKPLSLQSYWKPLDGHCRRFEIRRRSKVFKKTEKDLATREINNQAKRLVLQKSRSHLRLSTIAALPNLPQTDSEESDDDDNKKITSFDIRRHEAKSPELMSSSSIQSTQESSLFDNIHGLCKDDIITDSTTKDKDVTPNIKSDNKTSDSPPSPYLITLQGNGNAPIYTLDKLEITVGSETSDLTLNSSDVLGHHCIIKRRLEILFSESGNNETIKRWCVTIAPFTLGADIKVNGQKVTEKCELHHGELLSIGQQHIFMFKDPSSKLDLGNVLSFTFSKEKKQNGIKSISSEISTNVGKLIVEISKATVPELSKVIETEISYQQSVEDQILEKIFESVKDLTDSPGDYPLAPCTLLCQCMIHSCLNFNSQQKNDLMLKIASNLQIIVLNSTKRIVEAETKMSCESVQSIDFFVPFLRPVIFWMSNALEIFQFLQKDLIPIIYKRVHEEKEKKSVDPKLLNDAMKFTVNEAILALLEEVVMYAFQQLVYYLTKTLHNYLPAILDSNPFADKVTSGLTIKQVTDVYACARSMTQIYDVNQRITDQLFAYLFFFTNVSLFNTLMEEDSCSKYFSWEMGVRIRGNLELIESWAIINGCMEQYTTHMEKTSTLTNLLATPKNQFLKGDWPYFRETFPSLTPSQLKRVLNGYQMPGNQPKPISWEPSKENVDQSLVKDKTIESYDNHPPLVLPLAGSKINFRIFLSDSWYQKIVQELKVTENISQSTKNIERLATCSVQKQSHRSELPSNEVSPLSYIKEDESHVESCFNENDHVFQKIGTTAKSTEQTSTFHKLLNYESLAGKMKDKGDDPLVYGTGRIVTSSCSSSSEPEAYVIRQHRSPHQRRKISDVTIKPESMNDLAESEVDKEACDELFVLPISKTVSHASHVSSNRAPEFPVKVESNNTQQSTLAMPKEVFIVDIKKDKFGLGVGLVDGVATSLGVSGVFVRSLIPNESSTKKNIHSKQHDIIGCWLQEGRLHLGDRILAANGVSLIDMSYPEAIQAIRQAGDNVRLLVGRCGSKIAMKVTSSSC